MTHSMAQASEDAGETVCGDQAIAGDARADVERGDATEGGVRDLEDLDGVLAGDGEEVAGVGLRCRRGWRGRASGVGARGPWESWLLI